MSLLILDTEALSALRDPQDGKHRHVTALIQGAVARSRHQAHVTHTVPTAVRVETGWDRTDPGFAIGGVAAGTVCLS